MYGWTGPGSKWHRGLPLTMWLGSSHLLTFSQALTFRAVMGARLLLLLIGRSLPPSHQPSPICMASFHLAGERIGFPFCSEIPDCNTLLKFLSNKTNFCSHLIYLDQRGSASLTSFHMEKSWCELSNQFSNIIINLPHGIYTMLRLNAGRVREPPSI